MSFAAKLVVRKTASGIYEAGFASKVGKGETIATFGSWYGCQMRYKPFKTALKDARGLAAKLNAEQAASE